MHLELVLKLLNVGHSIIYLLQRRICKSFQLLVYVSLIESPLNHLEVDPSPRQEQNKGNLSVLVIKRAHQHSSRSRATGFKGPHSHSSQNWWDFFPSVHPPSETKGIKERDIEVMANQFSTFERTPKGFASPSEKAEVMLIDEARKQRAKECSIQLEGFVSCAMQHYFAGTQASG